MRWAKTKKDLDDADVPPADRGNARFKEYKEIKSEADPDNPGKKRARATDNQGVVTTLSEWVTYNNLDSLKKKAQRKYEIYCGGFLSFYDDKLIEYLDKELKNKVTVGPELISYLKSRAADHEIFFEWGDETHADKIFVTIYINPPAGNPDPPTPPAPPPPETST